MLSVFSDVGKFLLGEMSVIQLNPYYTDVSETGFVKWVKEPDNLTLIQTTSTVLANRTSAIEIDGLLYDLKASCFTVLYIDLHFCLNCSVWMSIPFKNTAGSFGHAH